MTTTPIPPQSSSSNDSSSKGIPPSPAITTAQRTNCLFLSCLALFGCIASFIVLPPPYALLSSTVIILTYAMLGSDACCYRRSGTRPYQPTFWIPHNYIGPHTWRGVIMSRVNVLRYSLPIWRSRGRSNLDRHEPVGVNPRENIPAPVTAAPPKRTTFGQFEASGGSLVAAVPQPAPAPVTAKQPHKQAVSYAETARNSAVVRPKPSPSPVSYDRIPVGPPRASENSYATTVAPPPVIGRKTFDGPPSGQPREPVGRRK